VERRLRKGGSGVGGGSGVVGVGAVVMDGGERCWARERERGMSIIVGEGWRRAVVGVGLDMEV